MIHIKIRTWRCTKCNLDARDFDPSNIELLRLHFPEKPNLKANECFNCGTETLEKVVDEKKKSSMTIIDSQADIDEARAKKKLEKPQRISTGVEVRLETDDESDYRIKGEIRDSGLKKVKDKKELETALRSMPKKQREFSVYREETAAERLMREDEEIGKMKIASPKKIKDLRDKYEDK